MALLTEPTHNPLIARISLVRERLEFIQIISNLNPLFLDPSLIRSTSNDGWTHPWTHFDALRNYLLLTCFDLLGQSSEWLDFNSWLNSKKHQVEVSKAINLNSGQSALEMIKAVNCFYTAEFGVKNSFYRFINEVLLPETKAALLYSISIVYARKFITYDDAGNEYRGSKQIKKIDDDESKMKFLYWLRNVYTHEATSIGSPSGGVWPKEMFSSVNEDGKACYGWENSMSRPAKEKDHFYSYGFRKWPDVLIETVEAGLAQVSQCASAGRSDFPCCE